MGYAGQEVELCISKTKCEAFSPEMQKRFFSTTGLRVYMSLLHYFEIKKGYNHTSMPKQQFFNKSEQFTEREKKKSCSDQFLEITKFLLLFNRHNQFFF